MLTKTQIEQREGKLTASRVACLMTGDADKIMNLWRELVGDPAFVPEDLSDIWAVQLGSWTEQLNLDWYEKRTGRTLDRRDADPVVHPEHDWAAATLDGWDTHLNAPVECKCVGGFEQTAKILERYAPQAHWQMIVTGAKQCVFSIIEGAREPVIEVVPFDDGYGIELFSRAREFMECVRNLQVPVVMEPVAAPVRPEKSYDMQGNNSWGANAATWLGTRQAKKDCDASEKELKALVPTDAVKCFGYGIEIRRDRAGRLSLKEKVS